MLNNIVVVMSVDADFVGKHFQQAEADLQTCEEGDTDWFEGWMEDYDAISFCIVKRDDESMWLAAGKNTAQRPSIVYTDDGWIIP